MISIARRNLLTEKTRFAISAGGVAFSVMLILVILSLYQGWQIKSTEYIRSIDTDIWVTQNGTSDISSSASIIPQAVGDKLKTLDGVDSVVPFVGRPLQFTLKGEKVNAYIVGVDPSNPVTGPKNVVSGQQYPDPGDIVLDKVLSENHHINLGDSIEIFGKKFRVAGIAEGANMFLFQFSFLNQKEASDIINLKGAVTYYLVKTQTGKVSQVTSEISKLGGLDALTKDKFISDNKSLINEVFIPIVNVLVFISVLVGTAVIGLTIYTVTIEKSHEFGVLKALGASNWQIYRILFEQALISGLGGYLSGLALTYFILWLIPQFVPVFITVTRFQDVILVGVLALLMSLIASYAPVRRIVRIDPALVFKT